MFPKKHLENGNIEINVERKIIKKVVFFGGGIHKFPKDQFRLRLSFIHWLKVISL